MLCIYRMQLLFGVHYIYWKTIFKNLMSNICPIIKKCYVAKSCINHTVLNISVQLKYFTYRFMKTWLQISFTFSNGLIEFVEKYRKRNRRQQSRPPVRPSTCQSARSSIWLSITFGSNMVYCSTLSKFAMKFGQTPIWIIWRLKVPFYNIYNILYIIFYNISRISKFATQNTWNPSNSWRAFGYQV